MISNHRYIKQVRQDFVNSFYNKVAVHISKVMPGNEMLFFNAYSRLSPENDLLGFGINDSDATRLVDIDDAGNVLSVVGKLRFTSDAETKNYIRNGKRHSDRMREAIFCDGTKTIPLTIWSDLIDIMKEDQLIQIYSASSRIYNGAVVMSTT